MALLRHIVTVVGRQSRAFIRTVEANVRKAVAAPGVTYMVAMDNDFALWSGFSNLPADSFSKGMGWVRFHQSFESGYEESEDWLRSLLEEAGCVTRRGAGVQVAAHGVEAPPDTGAVKSLETYIGYQR